MSAEGRSVGEEEARELRDPVSRGTSSSPAPPGTLVIPLRRYLYTSSGCCCVVK